MGPLKPSTIALVLSLGALSVVSTAWGQGPDEPCDIPLLNGYSREQIANNAGLHYLKSYPPGIKRIVSEHQVAEYLKPDGQLVTDGDELERIQSLNIPLVYKDVWISTDPFSHIQATAMDSKGRKQYRYHPLWIQAKTGIKFNRMAEFGTALPKMHEQESIDLSEPGLGKNKILASVAQIMERTAIRVGSDEYARENGTYGLTTFLKTHVAINGDTVTFHFIGKSSVEHKVSFEDMQVAEVLSELKRAPGKNLFQYETSDGQYHPVNAPMLNEYLGKISNGHFTAKDFRTWSGTVTAANALLEKAPAAGEKETEANILAAIDSAAERLGNTRSVARDNYIEPKILQAYRERAPFEKAKRDLLAQPDDSHSAAERLVLLLLK